MKVIDLSKYKLNPKDWKIYIDTCSLYKAVSHDKFWNDLEEVLQNAKMKFTITSSVFEEFKKHKHDEKHGANEEAKQLENRLAKYQKSELDLMSVLKTEGFADNIIIAKIKEQSMKCNLIYITNDLANAWDVHNAVNLSQSVTRGRKNLIILRVDKNGSLILDKTLKQLENLSANDLKKYFSFKKEGKYDEASAMLMPQNLKGKLK